MSPQPLTPKELMVLEFVKKFIQKKGVSPSYEEIKDQFGFASYFSVQRYLKQLETKGYVKSPWGNKKRSIEIVESPAGELGISLPFLGRVAAGRPIEALKHDESVDVPPWMVKKPGQTFALQVEGQSMIDDGIHDGDILVVQKQAIAHNGQTVVALIENEATVKRFFQKGSEVELRPSNPEMKSLFIEADQVSIAGVVVGLIRKFNER